MSDIAPQEPAYTPAAILHVFNNAIAVRETRQLVRLKGIYAPGRGANYGGMFYDSLEDEATDAQLTLVVPALLREKLAAGTTIECAGFINRRVTANASRIEIQLQLTEIIGAADNTFSGEELEAVALQRRKAAAGFRDVGGFLKSKLAREERANIAVLVGRNSVIEHDIKHALKEAAGYYDIVFVPVNLSSETEIIRAFDQQADVDVVVLARGGGENLDIFDRPALAEAALGLAPYFATAIGHEQDTPLLQKVADKAFITPTAFGQYLHDLYAQTAEELQHSKAKLIESIRKELAAGYEQRLQAQAEQLQQVEGSKKELAAGYERQLQAQAEQLQQGNELLEQAKAMVAEKAKPNVALVVLAVVVGLVIGAVAVFLWRR